VKTRHLASSVLLLVIAGFVSATSPAAAGEYSATDPRAERLLEPWIYQPRTVHAFVGKKTLTQGVVRPKKLRLAYAVPFRQEAMLVSVEVRPKLRKIIQFKLRF
jgi:hypothetical protein